MTLSTLRQPDLDNYERLDNGNNAKPAVATLIKTHTYSCFAETTKTEQEKGLFQRKKANLRRTTKENT